MDTKFPLIREPALVRLLEITKEKHPQSILEIGTCIGFSGSQMLSVCDAKLVTIEIDSERAEIAKVNFEKEGVLERVTQIVADASVVLEQHQISKKFDLIFLDGPKGQYARQLPYLVDLLNNGGILFADNVLFRGYVEDFSIVPRRFRTIAHNLKKFIDDCKNNMMLKDVKIENVGDGILIATKEEK